MRGWWVHVWWWVHDFCCLDLLRWGRLKNVRRLVVVLLWWSLVPASGVTGCAYLFFKPMPLLVRSFMCASRLFRKMSKVVSFSSRKDTSGLPFSVRWRWIADTVLCSEVAGYSLLSFLISWTNFTINEHIWLASIDSIGSWMLLSVHQSLQTAMPQLVDFLVISGILPLIASSSCLSESGSPKRLDLAVASLAVKEGGAGFGTDSRKCTCVGGCTVEGWGCSVRKKTLQDVITYKLS